MAGAVVSPLGAGGRAGLGACAGGGASGWGASGGVKLVNGGATTGAKIAPLVARLSSFEEATLPTASYDSTFTT